MSIDLKRSRGESIDITDMVTLSGVPLDLQIAGTTLVFSIIGSSITFDQDDPRIVVQGGGVVKVSLSAADTQSLDKSSYRYRLRLTRPDGRVKDVAEGRFLVGN